jgi:glutaminyl-tRNA synthetase
MDDTRGPAGNDFIRRQVAADLEEGRYDAVVTRFPPEPNGYLHVGHASHIALNFGVAREFGGTCHLRFDDTNPETEDPEFVRSIQEDIRWLGFDWGEHLYYASDYFERMYDCAEVLIRKGLAYVDSQAGDAIREGRGTVTEPGVEGPFRDRSVEENLDLFRRMRAGEFEDGAHVLRGKIDMASPNMLMRDPVFYRIRHAHHYRQGDDWCIYPLYDWAHCLEDAFEGVTHSLCTLEFDNNRELYDWVLDNVGFEEPRPHQYEWAGLDLENAVLSKRNIKPLVQAGLVSGWDDPRLSTIAACRRRGIPPEALTLLAEMVGVSKSGARTEEAKLDYAIRETLNPTAPRVMAVLDPLKMVITNYPLDRGEEIGAPYFPRDVPKEGSRGVPFSRELYIERDDFAEDPPPGFRRLVPGGEVRLRYAYVIRCDEVVRGADGEIAELRCTYDPESLGGSTSDDRKVKGIVHWVSAPAALDAEVRLYRPLLRPLPEGSDADVSVTERFDPASLEIVQGAKVEPSVASDDPDTRYQFERTGYFWRDPVDGRGDALVFNRIVELKSTYHELRAAAGRIEVRGEDVELVVSRGDRAGAGQGGPSNAKRPPRPSIDRVAAREADTRLAARYDAFVDDRGVSPELADVLAESHATADFFDAAVAEHDDPGGVAAWIVNDLRGLAEDASFDELPFGGDALGRLVSMVGDGTVSRIAAKDVLSRMVEDGGDPVRLVEEMGLEKVSDAGALGALVDGVLADWPEKVEEYRAGNANLIGLFVGQVMKASGGAADPKAARSLIETRLEA